MPHNPRLAIAREYLGLEHRYAETMLARIDAEDPMRREPSHEAVEAALDALRKRDWMLIGRCHRDIAEALTAAFAVMAGESVATEAAKPKHSPLPVVPDPPPEWTTELLAVVRWLADTEMGRVKQLVKMSPKDVVRFEGLHRAAFQPEPGWPPSGCVMSPGYRCQRECVRFDCPHAGERADG